MTEKYLYFGDKIVRSQTFTESVSGAVQTYKLTDAGFGASAAIDVSMLSVSADMFANGVLLVDVTSDGNQQFGSAYGSVSATDVVRVKPAALSASISGADYVITIANKTADPVNGITMSATNTHNDATVTQGLPLVVGDSVALPSSRFLGVSRSTDTVSNITFGPHTNEGAGNVDKIALTHDPGKFKEACEMVSDCLLDNRNQSGMIVFADDWNAIYYSGNPAGISSIAITLDT